MGFQRCLKCGEYHWSDKKCPEAFKVYHEEYNGDEPIKIRGYCFEDAAENYAKYYNQDDYPLMDGSDTDVMIVNQDGEEKYFNLSAEQSIDYCIREITKDEANSGL